MSHSAIAPSSAGIWGKPNGCTGWVTMSQSHPGASTPESMDGDAAHDLAAQMIEAGRRAGVNKQSRSIIGTTASNGVIYTDEIYDSAECYAGNVLELMRGRVIFGGAHIGIEGSISAPNIHPLSYGTVDFWLFDSANLELYIVDFKNGRGVVEAFENWQCINYAAGILNDLQLEGMFDRKLKVTMRIVQPRAYHRDGPVRDWTTTVSELQSYFDTLKANAAIALSPHGALKTGVHCRHCTARHACPAAIQAGVELYEVASTPLPIELSDSELGLHLSIVDRAKKHLDYLETGLSAQVEARVRAGKNIPGWGLEYSRPHEKWTASPEDVSAMGEAMGVDLRKPLDVITPTQARKVGLDETIVTSCSKRPPGSAKIVKQDNTNARQIFVRNL